MFSWRVGVPAVGAGQNRPKHCIEVEGTRKKWHHNDQKRWKLRLARKARGTRSQQQAVTMEILYRTGEGESQYGDSECVYGECPVLEMR
jgi:hypothetical protein